MKKKKASGHELSVSYARAREREREQDSGVIMVAPACHRSSQSYDRTEEARTGTIHSVHRFSLDAFELSWQAALASVQLQPSE